MVMAEQQLAEDTRKPWVDGQLEVGEMKVKRRLQNDYETTDRENL